MRRIILARIGWMKYYTGSQPGDEKPIGGGKNNEIGIGGEVRNFLVRRGKLYGVVQNANNAPILNLQRIDPKATSASLKNVLVIFFATDPRPHSKGQVVVGWYKNATVLSQYLGSPWWHCFVVPARNALLVPTYRRICSVPRGRNAPGQSNVFFLFDSSGKYRKLRWAQEVLRFVDTYSGPNLVNQPEAETHLEIEAIVDKELGTALAQGVQIDPAARKVIENTAMNSAKRYYELRGYRVLNVSSTRSYDLHCIKNGRELFVEVKGSQAPLSKIILTPNEVAFAKKHSKNMALYVLHSVKVTHNRRLFRASGGVPIVLSPWRIETKRLAPLQYFYQLAR